MLNNADEFAGDGAAVEVIFAFVGKLDYSFADGVERVIFAFADSCAGHKVRTALAYDNRTRACFFTGIELHAQILWARIPIILS